MTTRLVTACPLRGRLGETRYTRLHSSGERATESALLITDPRERPRDLFDWYFRHFGRWPVEAGALSGTVLAQLSALLPAAVLPEEVLADDMVLMPDPEITAFDAGEIVARQSTEATALLLRAWVMGATT